MRVTMSLVLAAIFCFAVWLYFAGKRPTPPPATLPTPVPHGEPVSPTPAPTPTSSPQPTPSPEPAPTRVPEEKRATWDGVERRILEITNQERAKARLQPLAPEDTLRETARAQSADMIERHFFDHVNPSGQDPADRMEKKHRRLIGTVGENIWTGTGPSFAANPKLAERIMDDWMHSPHHRENILREEFTHMGVGVIMRGQEVRATQNFGGIRAYLDHPLPDDVARGADLDLSETGDPPSADMFDLERIGGKSASKPAPVSQARVEVDPGIYRLRLYFRTRSNHFEIFAGPLLRVH